MQQNNIYVVNLGGSAVAPDKPDCVFLSDFCRLIRNWVSDNPLLKVIIVIGGGAAARQWQNAARELSAKASHESLDLIGIQATRLNAQLMRCILGDLCHNAVITNPQAGLHFSGPVLICAGWKPGFSTDYVSVKLAQKMRCNSIAMISNISHVYSEDPRINPQAAPISQITWKKYRELTNSSRWQPGSNMPFDPIASRAASETGLSVKLVSAINMANIRRLLYGLDFTGTTIGP